MKDKYPVTQYDGIPVILDNSGRYTFKSELKVHTWRNGKHTKGRFQKIGQLFLTENNQLVVIIATHKLNFKNRHQLTPLERFTKEFIDDDLLQTALNTLAKEARL